MNTATEPSGNRSEQENVEKPDEKDLHDLQQEELSGADEDEDESLALSDTDEDEDEGVGDGNIGGIKPGKVHR